MSFGKKVVFNAMQHLILLNDPLKNLKVQQLLLIQVTDQELKVQIKSEIMEVLLQKSGFQCHETFIFVARPPQKSQSANKE